jgi:hypothetical protein
MVAARELQDLGARELGRGAQRVLLVLAVHALQARQVELQQLW